MTPSAWQVQLQIAKVKEAKASLGLEKRKLEDMLKAITKARRSYGFTSTQERAPR